MGRFSTTTQIKNNSDRAGFISTFNATMEKRGFVPCAEDEAAKSYLLAFSEGGWVTFTSESDDVPKIVADMNAISFSVEVVDSDFAIIKLSKGSKEVDTVIVGDGSGYGFEEDSPKGEKKCWEPLLADGKTWRQLSEIWAKDEVFVEDALCKSAPLLGINSKYIVEDYNELFDMADNDKNIAALYFKEKAADKKSKPMTLNAAFKRVFGEALEPLGFKLIKSKYPYFVRVVPGGEIIHVITVKKESPFLHAIGRQGFTVLSGAATVYRPKIDLSVSPRNNTRWLSNIMSTYVGMNCFNFDSNLADSLSELSFFENNRESQLEAMKLALKHTENIVIPALNNAVNIDSFSRLCFMMYDGLYPERHFDAIENGELNPNDVDDEGLVLVKVKEYPSYVDWSVEYRKNIYSKRVENEFDEYSEKDYEDFCGKIDEYKQQYISKMSEIKNDTQFYDMIELELEKRRCLNIKTLRSYGIDI